MSSGKIKAITLDFDGVIVESVQVKRIAFKNLFKAYPDKSDEIADYIDRNPGTNRFDVFTHVSRSILNLDARYSEQQVAEIVHRWQLEFGAETRRQVVAAPWVTGALDFLAYFRGKLPLYLASATPLEDLQYIVRARKIDHHFDEIFGAPIDKSMILNELIHRHGITADEMLMVGDSTTDLEAAQKARTQFLGRTSVAPLTAATCFDDMQAMLDHLRQPQTNHFVEI